MNKKILLFLILLKSNLFADNEILSFVCVKRLNTRPGESVSALSLESLSNTLKSLNAELQNSNIATEKLKDYLDEYLDTKIFRIEYGTDLKTRSDLLSNYSYFMDKMTKLSESTSDPIRKKKFEELKNLRLFSYQIMTRGKLRLSEDTNKIPFWIEDAAEAEAQLINSKPLIYGKILDLLQFSGGYGDFYKNMPIAFGGMQLTDFLNLCITMNNEIKKKVCDQSGSFLNGFKKSCSLINATVDNEWQKQNFFYSLDVLDKEAKTDITLKTLGGIPQKTFIDIRDKLDDFDGKTPENLKLSAKIIYLNAAWSAGFMPILEPMLRDRGLMIGVVSTPSDNDSSSDITDKLYTKKSFQSNYIISAFFDWYKQSAMNTINTNNGIFPYIILKKIEGRLFVHYFMDPGLKDFIVGLEKREDAKKENILSKENFPGLQKFNEKYNKEANGLVERIYIWWCSWHTPITDAVIKQATDEALKVKTLLSFFQTSNIYLKPHASFDDFKNAALNLFETDASKQIK